MIVLIAINKLVESVLLHRLSLETHRISRDILVWAVLPKYVHKCGLLFLAMRQFYPCLGLMSVTVLIKILQSRWVHMCLLLLCLVPSVSRDIVLNKTVSLKKYCYGNFSIHTKILQHYNDCSLTISATQIFIDIFCMNNIIFLNL